MTTQSTNLSHLHFNTNLGLSHEPALQARNLHDLLARSNVGHKRLLGAKGQKTKAAKKTKHRSLTFTKLAKPLHESLKVRTVRVALTTDARCFKHTYS
jgi:hypothetical protein